MLDDKNFDFDTYPINQWAVNALGILRIIADFRTPCGNYSL